MKKRLIIDAETIVFKDGAFIKREDYEKQRQE